MNDWSGELALGRPPTGDPRKFHTLAPITFHAKHGTITVLAGFRTDGASVPKAFWWYAAPLTGKHAAAALVHDGLYRAQLISRKQADEVFYEGLLSSGVRKSKAWLMYQSVRKFGSITWNKTDPDASHVRLGVSED